MVLALAGMVLVYLGVGAILANEWQVDATRTVAVSAEEVGALVRDFRNWKKWSSMEARLGPQTTLEVTGEAGTVGHRMKWSGNQGQATLTMCAVAPGAIDYEFHSQGPQETQMLLRGKGRVEWVADGTGCRVHWHDEGKWDSLAGRWIGWFGALQERVKEIQATSLAGIERAVAESKQPPGK
ncbi:MAG TPA: SRPBCC family protein [Planctomycetota bacterium]|nr:SRPBCC family protein [Planctomycetota bacterium]